MSDYYRVRIDEYNEVMRVATQLATSAAMLKEENARLRADNQRLLNCIEKMAFPSAPALLPAQTGGTLSE